MATPTFLSSQRKLRPKRAEEEPAAAAGASPAGAAAASVSAGVAAEGSASAWVF